MRIKLILCIVALALVCSGLFYFERRDAAKPETVRGTEGGAGNASIQSDIVQASAGEDGDPESDASDPVVSMPKAASQPDLEPVQNASLASSESATVTANVMDNPALTPAVIESRQMVAAHASLRIPAVADPDSAENKAILQQMMFKALASPTGSTSTASSINPAK